MNDYSISDETVEYIQHSSLENGRCHFNGHMEQIKLCDLIKQFQKILDSVPKEHQQNTCVSFASDFHFYFIRKKTCEELEKERQMMEESARRAEERERATLAKLKAKYES